MNINDYVEIEDTYNKEGFLIKRKANNVPVFVPKELVPRVQIITPDTEWVTEKIFMTAEEFKNRFGELYKKAANGG